MSEDKPFKSLKITLSDEAISRLNSITKESSFRSCSSTIEECVRVVYDIITELYAIIGHPKDKGPKRVSQEIQSDTFERIATRMSRFTGWVIIGKENEE